MATLSAHETEKPQI